MTVTPGSVEPVGRRHVRISTAGGMCLLMTLAAAQVWVRSGSGWLWLLVVGVAVVLIGDGVVSFVALRRPDLTSRAPTDAQVGRPIESWIGVRRPRGRIVVGMSSLRGTPWLCVDAPQEGPMLIVPEHRGVFGGAEFVLHHSAPFGLVLVSRELYVELPTPVIVAPAPIATDARLLMQRTVDQRRSGTISDDTPRSVREYVSGDPMRLVHWPSTARMGRIMVKDTAVKPRRRLLIVVDLGRTAGPIAERVASVAMGVVNEAFRSGLDIEMVSRSRRGIISGRVDDLVSAGRQLAMAIPGAPIEWYDHEDIGTAPTDSVRVDPECVEALMVLP